MGYCEFMYITACTLDGLQTPPFPVIVWISQVLFDLKFYSKLIQYGDQSVSPQRPQ